MGAVEELGTRKQPGHTKAKHSTKTVPGADCVRGAPR